MLEAKDLRENVRYTAEVLRKEGTSLTRADILGAVVWHVLIGKRRCVEWPTKFRELLIAPRGGLVIVTARAWGYPLRGQQDPRYTHQSAKAGPCQKKCYYLVPKKAEKKTKRHWAKGFTHRRRSKGKALRECG